MRPATIIIQLICVALGALVFWSAFALSDKVLLGGLVVGCLFFMLAALLGADHTSNPAASSKRRMFFKVLAVLAILPILGFGFSGLVTSAPAGRWSEVAVFVAKAVGLAAVFVALIFDNHPKVRRLLRRKGISTPPNSGQ